MRLRKLEQKDISSIYGWMKDPEVNRFFQFDPQAVTLETVAAFVQGAQDERTHLHLACVDDADMYLGTISLKNLDRKNRTAEYAVSFCKSAQGTGAAGYATHEILHIAFERLALEKVYLNVLEENTRAIRFYEKNGFVYEGTFRRHILAGGVRKNLLWFGVLKNEWERSHEKS